MSAWLSTNLTNWLGDRAFADDKAIVGGIARLDGRPVMIIGHQKGRETKEKIRRNFGMLSAGRLPQSATPDGDG